MGYNKHTKETSFSLAAGYHRPVVVVMVQTMSDAVFHNGEELYLDRAEWLERTATIADSVKNTTWIFKRHPNDRLYDVTGTFDRIAEQYADSVHLVFVREEAPTGVLVELSDTMVTVSSTAGFEFAATMVPVILAGKSSYSGLGFTIEPSTIEEYENLLANISKIETLSPEDAEQAARFQFFEHEINVTRSTILPQTPGLTNLDYWRALNAIWHNNRKTNDPLPERLRLAIENGQNSVTWPDYTWPFEAYETLDRQLTTLEFELKDREQQLMMNSKIIEEHESTIEDLQNLYAESLRRQLGL